MNHRAFHCNAIQTVMLQTQFGVQVSQITDNVPSRLRQIRAIRSIATAPLAVDRFPLDVQAVSFAYAVL